MQDIYPESIRSFSFKWIYSFKDLLELNWSQNVRDFSLKCLRTIKSFL